MEQAQAKARKAFPAAQKPVQWHLGRCPPRLLGRAPLGRLWSLLPALPGRIASATIAALPPSMVSLGPEGGAT